MSDCSVKKNYYALIAMIFNPCLTYSEALSKLEIAIPKPNKVITYKGRPRVERKYTPESLREEYESGATITSLSKKYKVQPTEISAVIRSAGGIIIKPGGNRNHGAERTAGAC